VLWSVGTTLRIPVSTNAVLGAAWAAAGEARIAEKTSIQPRRFILGAD
jgi:hypothetical protein